MEALKTMFIIITITMALSITLTLKTIKNDEQNPPFFPSTGERDDDATMLPSRSLGRFLKEAEKNPRSATNCRKNKKMCEKMHGKNWKCCNNKCVDLSSDKNNCGGCKKKCKYTKECCRGKCVEVAYDKRHCGQCNHPCQNGKFCVYGMCEYA